MIKSEKPTIGDGEPFYTSPDLENKTANWGMDKVPGTTNAATGKMRTGGRKPIYVEGRQINPRTTMDMPDLENNYENCGLPKADPSALKQIFIRSVEGRHCCVQIRRGWMFWS